MTPPARAGIADSAGGARQVWARALASGPAAGALTLVVFFAIDLALALAGGETGMAGLKDPRVIASVMARARTAAIGEELTILAVLAAAGALFGALGGALARAYQAALGRSLRGARSLGGVLGALLGHGYLFSRSVLVHPQLYSALLYARGGARRALMVFLTDQLSPRALDTGFAVLGGALLVSPLLFSRGRIAARAGLQRLIERAQSHGRALLITSGALAVITLLLALPRRAARSASTQGRPNLLLIAVDSLRADRVFDPEAPVLFPHLAALAQQGVRFRSAFVTQARTFPSFVTLLTGRFSSHHGIRHEFPNAAARAEIGPTIASVLRDAGVRTAAVSDFSGDFFSRTPLGFQTVDAPRFDLFSIVREEVLSAHASILPYAASRLGELVFPTLREMARFDDPELLTDRAIGALDRLGGAPFFLTVFYSAPHFPYAAPWPYYQRFTDPGYQGPFRYLKEPLPMLAALPQDGARQVQGLYDGAVAATDAAIGRLLAQLAKEGLAKSTIVVLLGDHGENLFEVPGRGMGHGDHLWGDLTSHIPLVIVDPRGRAAPHDVDGIVRDVDLAPTLAHLLGVEAPARGDGVDLAPLLDGERDTLGLEAYGETGLWLLESGPGYRRSDRLPYPNIWHATVAAPDGDLSLAPKWEATSTFAKDRSIEDEKWKLVYQPTPAGAHFRLFDLVEDPAEREDVAAAHPEVVREMEGRIARFVEGDGHTEMQKSAE